MPDIIWWIILVVYIVGVMYFLFEFRGEYSTSSEGLKSFKLAMWSYGLLWPIILAIDWTRRLRIHFSK